MASEDLKTAVGAPGAPIKDKIVRDFRRREEGFRMWLQEDVVIQTVSTFSFRLLIIKDSECSGFSISRLLGFWNFQPLLDFSNSRLLDSEKHNFL